MVESIFKKLTQARKSKVFKAMSTLNLQVELKGPDHLLGFTAILQPGVPQEVSEADAASAFQVGCFLRFVSQSPVGMSTSLGSGAPVSCSLDLRAPLGSET